MIGKNDSIPYIASSIYKTTPPSPATKMAASTQHLSNSTLNCTGPTLRRRQRQIELFSQFGGKDAATDGWWVGSQPSTIVMPRNDGRKTQMDPLNQGGMIDNQEAIILDVLICFVFMLLCFVYTTSLSIYS